MKKIKFLLIFIVLSSCNKYLGSVDPDYIPSNELTDIFSNINFDINNVEVNIGEIIYPKKVDQSISINIQEIHTIFNADKKSMFNFFNDKIYLSKDHIIYEIDKENYKNISEYKLNLNNNEYVLHVFEYNNKIYFITNRSRK